MVTDPVWLFKAPTSPAIKWSSWGASTVFKLARWTSWDRLVAGGTTNNKSFQKRTPSEKAAQALVKQWVAEKKAEGWVTKLSTKPSKARVPAKSVKGPPWLTKVDKAELARIRAAIKKAKLDHRGAEIESLLRPAIRFDLTPTTTIKSITTRFGGDPDLPAAFQWPRIGKTPLAFVAQYRLDELARFDLERRLPSKGVLSVFVYLVPDGDAYCARTAVFYFSDPKQLRRTPAPHGKDADDRPGKQALAKPRLVLTLPSTDDREFSSLRLTDDERERYHDKLWLTVRDAPSSPAKPGAHTLLGYDRTLLAQIDSDRRFGLELGDVETLGLYLDPPKLKKRDFRRVRASLQS